MDGVLNVLKPPGMTSHDVVAYLRRLLRERRVGHTGTLDPGAAGVLPVCLGRATRLAEYLAEAGKAYRAEVTFGIATDTLDAYGTETERRPVPELRAGDLLAVLPRFQGEIWQTPPMYSAVKVGGRRLYELARAGQEVERVPRQVTIHRLSLVAFRPGEFPVARLDVVCSKGTYIRTLAADLGAALGVPAHLSHLVRTGSGPFTLETAVTLEELAAHGAGPYLVPPARALAHLPRLILRDPRAARAVAHGRAPRLPRGWTPPDPGRPFAVLGPEEELLAVASLGTRGEVRLLKVLVGE